MISELACFVELMVFRFAYSHFTPSFLSTRSPGHSSLLASFFRRCNPADSPLDLLTCEALIETFSLPLKPALFIRVASFL